MQISLEELQKVARAYRAQHTGAVPLEPVPAPFVACEEADAQLIRAIAHTLAQTPDVREERVREVVNSLRQTEEPLPASVVAVSIMRRLLADKLSQK
jgi:hypothetical protein